jgi:hypothetical protein
MRTLLLVLLTSAVTSCTGTADGFPDAAAGSFDAAPRPDGSGPAGLDATTSGRDAAPLEVPDGGAQDPVIAAWLQAHNAVRSSAQPPPSPPLAPLGWSAPAATVALGWSKNCVWEHNANRGDFGENISAATYELTPDAVVTGWADEAAGYDYASNGCSSVCGHYTQLVWRDTTSVGCAVNRCTTGSPFGSSTWYFAVCDYSPPGNYVGEKPY